MKVLKFILYTVLVLIVIYVIMCIAGPKKMTTNRSAVINATPASVYEEVADFNKMNSWSPFNKMDATMKNTITGEPGTVGHKNTWDGEKMGKGTQEIVEVVPNEKVRSKLLFDWGPDANYSDFILTPADGGTKATWTFEGADMPFMMRGMMMIMGNMDKTFDEGLANLKAVAEAKPPVVETPAIAYEVMDMPAQWYVGKMFPGMAEGKIDQAMYTSAYDEIEKAIGGKDKMNGMPMSIAHNYSEANHTMDLEIAMPVAAEMKVPAGLTCAMIPAGKSAKHVYRGAYEGLGMEWSSYMTELMKTHTPRWDGYEVYATDPSTVSSPAEYETWLIQPVN